MSKVDETQTLKCSHCKEFKPPTEFWRVKSRSRGYDHYCKACRKALHNKIGAAHAQRRYEARNKGKQEARILVRKLIASGKMTKQNCFVCSDEPAEAHHIDYDFPDKVVWLCTKHHVGVHYG